MSSMRTVFDEPEEVSEDEWSSAYDQDEADEDTNEEGEDGDKPTGIDLSQWPPYAVANLSPLSRQIMETGRVPETPANPSQQFSSARTADDQPQRRLAAPTIADFAEDYLHARQYVTSSGLRLRRHRDQWLYYTGTHYEPMDDEDLKADVTNYFNGTPHRSKVNKSFVSGILDQLTARCLIRRAVSLPARQSDNTWYELPETVTLENGLINLAGVRIGIPPELKPHTPHFVSRCVLPYRYDPAAQCPGWLKFLEEILPDEGSRTLLQQLFGYCLTFDTSRQKFFMFEGTGGNGKSVVTAILRHMVGRQNTTSLSLSRFNDKHGLVMTYGKLVNFTGELREKDKIAEDLLKQATGGDLMSFEEKYKPAFSAPFTAKIIVCTNERPAFTDRSNGLWRRLIILPFPISIPPEKQDAQLEQTLAAELPGILNWAIQGAISLNDAGGFKEPHVSIDARMAFQKEANPARQFFEDCCRVDANGQVGTQILYARYKEYVSAGGYRPLNQSHFKKEVLLLPGVTETRVRVDTGSKPHIYRGITSSPEGS